METRTYIKQLFSESAIYGLSRVAIKLVNIFIVPLYTRFFSPDEYGLLGIINNGTYLFTILLMLGLDSATAVYFWDKEDTEEQKKTISTWFWIQTLVSIIIVPIIIFSSNQLEKILAQPAGSSYFFIVAAFILFFSLPSEVFLNWLRLQRKPKESFLYSVFISILLVGLNLLFIVKMNLGFIGILYSQVITTFAGALIAIFSMRNWISLKHFNFPQFKKMFRYSSPLIPAAIASWLITSSAVYFINHFLDSSQAGIYQVGNILASGMGLFVMAFQMAWGPFALSIQRNTEAKKIYALVLQLYTCFSVLLAVFLFLFAKEILVIFTNEKYFSADVVSGILGFNVVVGGFTYIASIGLNIEKSSVPYSTITIFGSLLMLILFFILIKPFGIEGAALASLCGQIIVPIYLFFAAQKKYFVPYNFPLAIGMFVMGIFFAGVAYYAKETLNIYLKILLFFILVIVFLLINKNLLKEFRRGNS
jgi:O-antigen/teichoic acid export membrane protein